MFMAEELDAGDMLLKETVKIEETDNYETLYNKLKVDGGRLIVKTLEMLCLDYNSISREKQVGIPTFAPMITKEMTKIDFNNSSRSIFNLIRGLSPVPACYMAHQDGRIFKVYNSFVVNIDEIDKNTSTPGTVVLADSKKGLIIKTEDGFIELTKIQEQSSKMMDSKDYLRGKKIDIGTKFI